jgi:acetolactate synthase-1/2/3 large subunit
MTKRRHSPEVGRRNFLKGATLVGAAAVTPRIAEAQPAAMAKTVSKTVPQPNLVAETMPPPKDPVTQTTSGGDFMVDVLKTLDFDIWP